MTLDLPKHDALQAAKLIWWATKRSAQWQQTSFEDRARLRAQYRETIKSVRAWEERSRGFDLSLHIQAIASEAAWRWPLHAIGVAVIVFVFCCYMIGDPDPHGFAQRGPAAVAQICFTNWLAVSVSAAAAWLTGSLLLVFRGYVRVLSIVRHARRARRDSQYLLVHPKLF